MQTEVVASHPSFAAMAQRTEEAFPFPYPLGFVAVIVGKMEIVALGILAAHTVVGHMGSSASERCSAGVYQGAERVQIDDAVVVCSHVELDTVVGALGNSCRTGLGT